jgi:predicted O-methyltransferase YrrM
VTPVRRRSYNASDMPPLVPETVTSYLASLTPPGDERLDAVRRRSLADAVPAVDSITGALLFRIAMIAGASRILEIGTGYGYSTVWLGRALGPEGTLVTMERQADRAAVAREHLAQVGLADRVSVIVGEARRFLAKVAGPFDVIFQDGDKTFYEPALDRLAALLRPGGVLVTNTVLWSGDVVPGSRGDPAHPQDTIDAIAAYNVRLAGDPRLHTLVLPVGDGVAVSVRKRG